MLLRDKIKGLRQGGRERERERRMSVPALFLVELVAHAFGELFELAF
jgi:hypothetical protein